MDHQSVLVTSNSIQIKVLIIGGDEAGEVHLEKAPRMYYKLRYQFQHFRRNIECSLLERKAHTYSKTCDLARILSPALMEYMYSPISQ